MAEGTTKQCLELDLVRRLLLSLDIKGARLQPSDRPDVLASVDGGRTIGIEVTVFQADERPDGKGSPARAQESNLARHPNGGLYLMWVTPEPLPGLEVRISDKIRKAEKSDTEMCDELWLLIAASVPMPAAVASTYLFDFLVTPQELNARTDELLRQSQFDAVYLHVHLTTTPAGEGLFRWSPENRWSGSI